jgi:hypothetical protein
VALSCPNCEWSAVERFEHTPMDELELELDRGDAELEVDLALARSRSGSAREVCADSGSPPARWVRSAAAAPM